MIDVKQLNVWLSKIPPLKNHFKQDSAALTTYVKEGEKLLAELPKKLNRNAQEKLFSEQILNSCRQLRCRFMEKYAAQIYAVLTSNFVKHRRLVELAYDAAQHFPGLVPTKQQIEAERKCVQSQKEGLEIDQGIFFRGLLRVPAVGSHIFNAMLIPCPRALSIKGHLQHTNKIDLGTILFEKQGSAAYLTINHPHCLNAEDDDLIDDMETAVDLVLLDETIKVGVLRGGVMTHPRYSGKRVFCSGINLTQLYAGKISFVEFLLTREFGYINKIAHGLIMQPKIQMAPSCFLQKPWIAAVDSFAIGGGMQLLLVFDKIISADDAYYVLPAAKEGIIPGAANFRLAKMVGSRLARQIILFGRKIYANDAKAQWLCDEVVPSMEMDAAIETAIQELDNSAVIENRKMLNLGEEPREKFIEYMAEFAYIQAQRLYSSDVLSRIENWAQEHKSARKKEEEPCS